MMRKESTKMRVQSVQNKYNNSNYNKPDFGALEIRDAKWWQIWK